MNAERANRIYDLLVSIGGASESERFDFIYHHTESEYGCSEWRFCGHLGFGGKYWCKYNSVSCYREDETSERTKIMNFLNEELSKI